MNAHLPTCPSCGGEVPPNIQSTKLAACAYCDSLLFLEDAAVQLAGKQGVVKETPSLINIGEKFRVRGETYHPVGQLQLAYELGFWDEYWCLDSDGKGFWISVDEGDIAIETEISTPQKLTTTAFRKLKAGNYHPVEPALLVTETGTATCLGIKGSIPDRLRTGDSYDYAHLRNGADFFSLEYSPENSSLHPAEVFMSQGFWVDPFEVET